MASRPSASGSAQPTTRTEIDFGTGSPVIGSRFTNKEIEGRVEVQHSPIGTTFGVLRGAVGVQADGPDLAGKSFDGDSLLDPARTGSVADFGFEELQMPASFDCRRRPASSTRASMALDCSTPPIPQRQSSSAREHSTRSGQA
jgi:hypothetical protein